MKHFGDTLRSLLDEKQISRIQLAIKIGKHPSQISQYLNKASVDTLLLSQICQALEVSPMVFFGDDNLDGLINSSTEIGKTTTDDSSKVKLLLEILKEKERFISYLLSTKGKDLTAGETIDE